MIATNGEWHDLRCDHEGCHARLDAPRPKFRAELLWARARGYGWRRQDGQDLCPDHIQMISAGDLSRWLGDYPRRRRQGGGHAKEAR